MQILVNLVKNALKFSREGPIRLFVAYDPEEFQLTVQVVDEGKGILPDEKDKISKFLSRASKDANDADNNTIGMGLFICKNIIDFYEGEIQVFSSGKNLGTTVQFTLGMKSNQQSTS